MRRLLIGLALLLGLGMLLALSLGAPPLEVLVRLAFGWWSYLARVAPQVTVSWDGMITGLVGLLLFATGLHLFLRWLHGEIRRGGGAGTAGGELRRWRPRWTASIVAVVVLMFVAGIGAVGVTHQVGWLLRSKRPHLQPVPRPVVGYYGRHESSMSRLNEVGLGLHNYVSTYDSLPTVSIDSQGRRLHSWQKGLLPYIGFWTGGEIRDDLPWNDPENSAYFRAIVPTFLNPEIAAVRSPEGYALSHYAGNIHVLGREDPLTLDQVTNGTANTIAAGEAAGGFKPWGDPTNLRDPERGIDPSADGFGGPSAKGANLLFLDGSVRFVKATIDPEVLRRMSRPEAQTGPRPLPRSPGSPQAAAR